MKNKIYKTISVICLTGVMLIIFILSQQDTIKSSETSGFVTKLLSMVLGNNIPEALVRTFGHYSEFAILGLFSINCFFAFRNELKPIISIILSWCYAWTDEIHQIFVDGRAFQISDLLVDLAGIVTGTIVFILIIKATQSIKKRRKL
ncbi:MAG: VanZ family protein [Clostridia bacterium]|nr:VanZ family protein [Clostridia bacterium]